MFIVLFTFVPLTSIQAATLTLDFNTSFGNPGDPDTAPPDGLAPWLTAVFDDGNSAGSVTLTITLAGSVGIATVNDVYFNFDPTMDATQLTITRNAGLSTAPVENSISQGTDLYKPANDGLMDILFDFPPPTNSGRFEAGEVAVYNITDIGNLIVASSFNFLSAPDPDETDPSGPWLAAAQIISTGSDSVDCKGGTGECSDWIAPMPAIPVPASVWLFGSAIGLLGWMRRKAT